ncbi:MAG TPA: squalene/phytoene synthase family protein [Xanthobacteraceae bacterium]|nr:squalene/phytoene synthase family protein [Xanthobacteraceae bacterium]
MQDAFAYCAELVRAADRDRYLAALFAPSCHRDALHALYAFNIEVARVRDAAPQALAGEIRLQWWMDVLRGERPGEASANPVAAALLAALERYDLASDTLIDLIDAHRFDLYDEPMARLADLEAYAGRTSSALFALAAQILAGSGQDAVTVPAGKAYATAALLHAFPLHAARHQLYVPVELLERYGVRTADVFAGRASAGLDAALAELRTFARGHLHAVRACIAELPTEALPALLPTATVRSALDRLEQSQAFSPDELALWRRQWLIWRAAHNPARIAN